MRSDAAVPVAADSERNKAVALQFMTAVSQGRSKEVMHLLTDDAVWWINGQTQFSGSHRVDEMLVLARRLFGDTDGAMTVSFDTITADGNRVSMESHARAKFIDGREYDQRVHLLMLFRDGRIVAVKEYLDTEQLARVFGDPRRIVRRLYEDVVGRRDFALLDELIAPDAVDFNAQQQGWPAGAEGFRRHVEFFHGVFADLDVTVDDLVVDGERVVAFWTLRATHGGVLWGVPPTGRRIAGRTISIVRVRNGRVVEYESRPDRLGFLLEVGSFGSYAEQLVAAST